MTKQNNNNKNDNQDNQVSSLMRSKFQSISADSSLQEAAQLMKELECGMLPVGNENSPEGVITDRDIVLRAVAEGKNIQQEKVKDYMTSQICSCNENDTIQKATEKMNQFQTSRLFVENDNGRICGVLTFGHVMRKNSDKETLGCLVKNVMQTEQKAA